MRGMLIFLTLLAAQAYAAPQFFTFKDGKLGVNFGGYHAGVGLGGILGGSTGGGLFAEAGTPHGQSARAGLGGSVHEDGRAAGGLYAGATAGRNINAAAGLGGNAASDDLSGQGFAFAQAGKHHAGTSMVGATNVEGSVGATYAESSAVPSGIVKETVKYKKVHKELNVDALNEIKPEAAAGAGANVQASVDVSANAQPTFVVKEVHVEQPPLIIEKHVIHKHTKPHHHVHKTAYIGGYIGADAEAAAPAGAVYKTGPVIEKRIDVGVHNAASGGAVAETGVHGGGEVTYNREITVSKNPTFFQDIFNIPISALKAVSSFLTNTAENTNVSVKKTATVHTDSDSISPKHASSVSSSSSSDAQISVETPSASQLIDGIFAIPINTLGAVNKFLDNNVPLRKRKQVTEGESEEPTRVRLGPHARRRANKRVVILEEDTNGS